MLSREKGQRVATRPVADADAEESRGVGPPASADNEVPRRIPVKTNARTINELRLRLGGRWNEERMRVARVCGIRVTVGGCLVTSRCVYSADCTSIESGYRIGKYGRPVVDTRGAFPPRRANESGSEFRRESLKGRARFGQSRRDDATAGVLVE